MLVDAFNEIFSIGNLLMMNIGVAVGILIGVLWGYVRALDRLLTEREELPESGAESRKTAKVCT